MKFLIPGHGLPDRVPDHPDPLHDQRRVLELLDRPHPHARTRRSTRSRSTRSSRRANGRQFDMAPARDSSGNLVLILHDETSGKVYVGTTKGLDAAAEERRHARRDSDSRPRRKGYTLIKGAELFALDQQLARLHASRRRATRRSSRRARRSPSSSQPTLRYDAKRDVVRPDHRRQGLPRQRPRLVRRRRTEELEPGWKTYVGFRNFSQIINDPLDPQAVPPRSSSGRSSSPRSTVFFSFAIGLFLAIALDKRGHALPAALPLGARSSRTRSRASSRCSSGRAC